MQQQLLVSHITMLQHVCCLHQSSQRTVISTIACAAGVVTRTADRNSSRYRYSVNRRTRQLALDCEGNCIKSTHDAYETTWKFGELKLQFFPIRRRMKKTQLYLVCPTISARPMLCCFFILEIQILCLQTETQAKKKKTVAIHQGLN